MRSLGWLVMVISLRASAMPCAATPQVRDALDEIDANRDDDVDQSVAAARSLKQLHALAERFPADPFVARSIYYAYSGIGDLAGFARDLQSMRALGLDESWALYLEGLALEGDDKAEEEKLRAAIAKNPKNAAAHEALADRFIEQKKMPAARAEALLAIAACPDSDGPYQSLSQTKDDRALATRLKAWRVRLDASNDPHAFVAYGVLWQLSFQGVAPLAQNALRKRVAADLVRLRSILGDHASLPMLATLAKGYKTTGDATGTAWVLDERRRLYPNAGATYEDAHTAWMEVSEKAHPRTPDERHALAALHLESTREWVKKWPKLVGPWSSQLDALVHSAHPSMAEVDATLKALHDLDANNYLAQAEALVRLGLHLERVAGLTKKALAHGELAHRAMARYAKNDNALAAMLETQLNGDRFGAWEAAALAELRLGHPAPAKQSLAEMERALPALAPDADDEQMSARRHLEQSIAHVKGHLALVTKSNADALAYFLHCAALLDPDERPPEAGEDDARNDAEAAWKVLGGTAATFALMPRAETKKEDKGWKAVLRPQKPFALHDLTGKTWRLADLKGKVVVVNAWATWCGPCKEEMPEVKALYAKLVGRSDVVFLSFNLDVDIGGVAPFVKENAIAYPVLFAAANDDLVPDSGIPYSMVINRSGVVIAESLGFDQDAPAGEWVKHALAAIEKAK